MCGPEYVECSDTTHHSQRSLFLVLLGDCTGPPDAGLLGVGGTMDAQAVQTQSWKSIWSDYAEDWLPRISSLPKYNKGNDLMPTGTISCLMEVLCLSDGSCFSSAV